MSERQRPGYISITIDMPLEVAEWFGANGEKICQLAQTTAAKSYRNSETAKILREEQTRKHQCEFHQLGRLGYRLLRHIGLGSNLAKNRDAIREIADNIGEPCQRLEFAIIKFKRDLNVKRHTRRIREIGRLYWAGATNAEIAIRQSIHSNTVQRYIREVIKLSGRRA